MEQAALVHCLSHRRLVLGFGRSYLPHEFPGFGITPEEGHDRFDQALHVVVKALEQLPDFTYDTPLFMGERITIWPRLVQRPIPYEGAAISDASFRC